jgi:hypothetical protein
MSEILLRKIVRAIYHSLEKKVQIKMNYGTVKLFTFLLFQNRDMTEDPPALQVSETTSAIDPDTGLPLDLDNNTDDKEVHLNDFAPDFQFPENDPAFPPATPLDTDELRIEIEEDPLSEPASPLPTDDLPNQPSSDCSSEVVASDPIKIGTGDDVAGSSTKTSVPDITTRANGEEGSPGTSSGVSAQDEIEIAICGDLKHYSVQDPAADETKIEIDDDPPTFPAEFPHRMRSK